MLLYERVLVYYLSVEPRVTVKKDETRLLAIGLKSFVEHIIATK